MRSNTIARLMYAVLLLLISQSIQAGSFFSFNIGFDSHGGYYKPYRYVYSPSYLHGGPYYSGYTYAYPVTYTYYPSVVYRPVYPYHAYHSHRDDIKSYYHHDRYYKPRYGRYNFRPRVQSSTHVYGYQQPRRTDYYPSKHYYQEQQYRDTHYNRYDKRRYDQYQAGQTAQQAANQRATRAIMERHRAKLNAKRRLK